MSKITPLIVIGFVTAISVTIAWFATGGFKPPATTHRQSFNVEEYRRGSIIYLVFRTSDNNNAGIHVVNYTSDSMEYEFLHQPTKTSYNEDRTSHYEYAHIYPDSALQIR